MTEEQKAERKALIENNKLMRSATTVRRDWVKKPAGKEAGPKGWQYFTVHAITHAPKSPAVDGEVATEMVGAKVGESNAWAWNPLRDHVAKTTTRPEFSLIALVCAGHEKTIATDSWRSPSQAHRNYLSKCNERVGLAIISRRAAGFLTNTKADKRSLIRSPRGRLFVIDGLLLIVTIIAAATMLSATSTQHALGPNARIKTVVVIMKTPTGPR
jgi:hypothetical protein